jgi:hypothetical protein
MVRDIHTREYEFAMGKQAEEEVQEEENVITRRGEGGGGHSGKAHAHWR